ncbi:uncharacterized protein K489DRAFT_123446 [Dissoconium aciculare CBS 342.82]|uniref:Ubiquitin fusion degradation protein n=1 Tax=Dissoconium aciculare CBS 342.82 TaxID=1314786 RepID=A0A6J3MFG2_9PEZI|nr:uncharacterized protein K489DRAFT_123446 [Dissoconium aciculare CBS 342.82]KAF1826715.1 hypothetical protein K489DRAFT_123446 [Dissoconium aciculare CBS 342.82]
MSNTPALEWSSQVRVANPSSLSQPLSGDKITLPPSALEQLLSASTKWAAESARRDLPAYDPFNSATHFAYRQAESQYEDQRQQLPHPLTFRLVNAENGRVVYAGIREFSAAEGEVALSPFLREALEIRADSMSHGEIATLADDEALADVSQADPRPQITIHARQLPKGTFVKLRPLAAGYDVDDWKALLEQHLRKNYTTLTNGEILIVPGSHGTGGKKEEFRFLVDGFKPEVDAICVVDTDLEVDIEALNEEQARETLRRIAAKTALAPGTEQGSTIGGDLDLFKAQQGRVLPGEYVDYILPSWNRTLPIEIELEAQGETESLGLLVSPLSPSQRSKPRIDAFVLAELDSRPRKRIRLEPGAIQIEDAEAMFVTVFAFGDSQITSEDAAPAASTDNAPILFSLRASHPDAISADGTAPDEAAERIAAGEVRCKNCGHWVPQARLPLHEATCYRNNILCPKGCGQVFQKRSVEYERHWHCAHDLSYGNAPESLHHHNFKFLRKVIQIFPTPKRCLRASLLTSLPMVHEQPSATYVTNSFVCATWLLILKIMTTIDAHVLRRGPAAISSAVARWTFALLQATRVQVSVRARVQATTLGSARRVSDHYTSACMILKARHYVDELNEDTLHSY